MAGDDTAALEPTYSCESCGSATHDTIACDPAPVRVPADARTVLTKFADVLDHPEERKRIAKLCADKEAVVALIALMLRVGASGV